MRMYGFVCVSWNTEIHSMIEIISTMNEVFSRCSDVCVVVRLAVFILEEIAIGS